MPSGSQSARRCYAPNPQALDPRVGPPTSRRRNRIHRRPTAPYERLAGKYVRCTCDRTISFSAIVAVAADPTASTYANATVMS